jgi:hypothetical protein
MDKISFPFCRNYEFNLNPDLSYKFQFNKPFFNKINNLTDVVFYNKYGLLESYIISTVIEFLKTRKLKVNYVHSGNSDNCEFFELLEDVEYDDFLTESDMIRFPTLFFYDKDNRIYFNFFRDYRVVHDYIGNPLFSVGSHVAERLNFILSKYIFKNYQPKLVLDNKSFENWKIANKFNDKKPYVLLIPDKTKYSCHNYSYLQWNSIQIKTLAALLKLEGKSLVVFSDDLKYSGDNIYLLPVNLNNFFSILPKTECLLSNDLDYLLINIIHYKIPIITKKVRSSFYNIRKSAYSFYTPYTFLDLNLLTPENVNHIIKNKIYVKLEDKNAK